MKFVQATDKHIKLITDEISLLKVEDAKGIACELKGETIAVCMMDTWLENSVQLHLLIVNPVCLKNYTFMTEVFNYVFNVANRGVALVVVANNNKKSLRFTQRIGFKETARIKDGHKEGVDSVILEMRRENCPWINHKQEVA